MSRILLSYTSGLLELNIVAHQRIIREPELRQEGYVLRTQLIDVGHGEARNTEPLAREGHHKVYLLWVESTQKIPSAIHCSEHVHSLNLSRSGALMTFDP